MMDLRSSRMALGLIALAAFAGVFAVSSGVLAGTGVSLTGNAAAGDAGVLKIPASEITGDAKFYEYETPSGTVRFFAIRASDGSVKTAFDACDICWQTHKGYRQEGDFMVCNNCGNKYAIDSLGTKNMKGGGCWPGYLPSTVSGGNLVIQKADLNAGAWRFE